MALATKSSTIAREPLYLQVCELLARQIADGVWKPNAALPNELELARELGVSGGTVRKALERLEADRLVVRRQGRGTFVIDQTTPEVASRFDRLRQGDGDPIACGTKLLQQGSGEPTLLEQKVLHIGPGETVARKRKLLSTSSRAFAVEDACLAISRLPGLEIGEAGDWSVNTLAQRHGVHVARACENVRPLPAAQDIAALLSIKTGTMLLRLDRVIYSADRMPIEWRRVLCHVLDEYYLAEVS
jgi:GntR family transcriptional regulator